MIKRALLLMALVACNSDIDEPWQLAHDRIIAVRAEPPGLMPGEQARVSMLVGFEEQPTATRAPDVGYVVSPMSLADAMAPSGDEWIVTAPSDERIAAARTELGLAADAPVPLVIGVAAAWPNPVMSPNPAGFGATKTVWLGQAAANPELTGLMIGGVEAPPEGAELVVVAGEETRLSVEADEKNGNVNWLSSCGAMHDFDLASAYLTVAPEDPQAGELAIVVRDATGGVAWRVWPIRAE